MDEPGGGEGGEQVVAQHADVADGRGGDVVLRVGVCLCRGVKEEDKDGG